MCEIQYNNWETFIINKKCALIRATSYGPYFKADLRAKGIISDSDIAELDACRNKELRISKLYDIIQKKDNLIQQLLQALEEDGQSGVVAILKEFLELGQGEQHIEVTTVVPSSPVTTTPALTESCSSDSLISQAQNTEVGSNINNRRNSIGQLRNEKFWTTKMKIVVALISSLTVVVVVSAVGQNKPGNVTLNRNGTRRADDISEPEPVSSPPTTATLTLPSIPSISSENKSTFIMEGVISSASSPRPPSQSQLQIPRSRKKKIIKEVRTFVIESPTDLSSNVSEICDGRYANRLIFSNANSYNFEKFTYSCPTRVDGITFLNSDWRIDQIASLLNKTKRLTYLEFKGSSICTRNEGFRVSSMDEISLYYLTHLAFHDLSSYNGNADCTEPFLWMASRVNDFALKVLSFRGIMITQKNQVDIHQLIFRALRSTLIRKLDIVGVAVNVEMFKDAGERVPVRRMKSVRFHANNSGSDLAKKSLFNLIDIYFNGSSIQDFATNIPVSLEETRKYLKALHKRNVARLRTTICAETCDPVDFTFLHDIPNLLKLELTVIFSKECKERAKAAPINFEKDQLAGNVNYHEIRVRSNANFKAERVTRLHCREYWKGISSKTQMLTLTLHRNIHDLNCKV